jgi:hypothetical protein
MPPSNTHTAETSHLRSRIWRNVVGSGSSRAESHASELYSRTSRAFLRRDLRWTNVCFPPATPQNQLAATLFTFLLRSLPPRIRCCVFWRSCPYRLLSVPIWRERLKATLLTCGVHLKPSELVGTLWSITQQCRHIFLTTVTLEQHQ